MNFVAGKNLAALKVIAFDLGGLFQNLSRGYFHPDGSGEGVTPALVLTRPLVLNTTSLRWEGAGHLRLVDAAGVVVIDNEAAVSVAIAPTKLPRPWDAAPVDVRASGLDVNGNPWSLVSVGGPDVQGTMHDNTLHVDVPIFVVHVECELG